MTAQIVSNAQLPNQPRAINAAWQCFILQKPRKIYSPFHKYNIKIIPKFVVGRLLSTIIYLALWPYVNNYCTLYTHKQTRSCTSLLSNLAVKVGSAFLAFLTVSCFHLDCKQALADSRSGTSVVLDQDVWPGCAVINCGSCSSAPVLRGERSDI